MGVVSGKFFFGLIMVEYDVEYTKDSKVYCEGKDVAGVPSHPGVYLNMGDRKEVVCQYCGKKFALEGDEEEKYESSGEE